MHNRHFPRQKSSISPSVAHAVSQKNNTVDDVRVANSVGAHACVLYNQIYYSFASSAGHGQVGAVRVRCKLGGQSVRGTKASNTSQHGITIAHQYRLNPTLLAEHYMVTPFLTC